MPSSSAARAAFGLMFLIAALSGCAREREAVPGRDTTTAAEWPPAPPFLDGERYWAARKIVVLAVHRRADARVDSVRIIDDGGDPAAAESLRAATEANPVPMEGDAEPWTETLYMALDPGAISLPDRERLEIPEFARSRLQEPFFREWLAALHSFDTTLTLDTFLAGWSDTMPPVPAARLLHAEEMATRVRTGVLSFSPDSQYVLDPFAGWFFDGRLRAHRDADAGYALFDARSGDRLTHVVGTMWEFDLGGWIDSDRFVLVGRIQLDHPENTGAGEWLQASAPVIVIGDAERRVAVIYPGAPVKRYQIPEAMVPVRRRAYPNVSWEAP